jgi:hypothetical protein
MWFKKPISYYDKINSYIFLFKLVKFKQKYIRGNMYKYSFKYKDNNKLIKFSYVIDNKEIISYRKEIDSKIIQLKNGRTLYNNDEYICFIQIIKTTTHYIIHKTRIDSKKFSYRIIYLTDKKSKMVIIGFKYFTIFNKIYIIKSAKIRYVKNYNSEFISNYKNVILFFDRIIDLIINLIIDY